MTGGSAPAGSTGSPGSQCGPWIAQGTTCSRRQKTAPRRPRLAQPVAVSRLHFVSAPGALRRVRSGSCWVRARLSDRFTADGGRARIIVLEGDQTGQELLEQALRLLDPDVCGLELELEHYDLSLREPAHAPTTRSCSPPRDAMVEAGYGVKAATITPEGKDDVGSPNTILREQIDGKVIVRTGRRIPGVPPVAAVHHPIAVVRMAVGDAYGAEERRESTNGDEVAFRTERIERSVCRAVAEYAFRTAKRMHARVYGGPKWTVSPIYEGMLKEELDRRRGTPSRRPLQPAADRRRLCGPGRRRADFAARDPGAEP